jgi:hypothetical protein
VYLPRRKRLAQSRAESSEHTPMTKSQRSKIIDLILMADESLPEPMLCKSRDELKKSPTKALIYAAIELARETGFTATQITDLLCGPFGITKAEFDEYTLAMIVCDEKDQYN